MPKHARLAALASSEAAFEAAEELKEHIKDDETKVAYIKVAPLLDLGPESSLGMLVVVLCQHLVKKLGAREFWNLLAVQDFERVLVLNEVLVA